MILSFLDTVIGQFLVQDVWAVHIDIDEFLSSIFLAPSGALKAKSSAATSAPAFQSLIWMLYCGPWSTALDVMT